MRDPIFDYDNGNMAFRLSDNMAMDPDGNILHRMSDHMAMNMDSGEIHHISSWHQTGESDEEQF